jgi:hypothetical protein
MIVKEGVKKLSLKAGSYFDIFRFDYMLNKGENFAEFRRI